MALVWPAGAVWGGSDASGGKALLAVCSWAAKLAAFNVARVVARVAALLGLVDLAGGATGRFMIGLSMATGSP